MNAAHFERMVSAHRRAPEKLVACVRGGGVDGGSGGGCSKLLNASGPKLSVLVL